MSELTRAALATPDMPVLGICAGCQVLNIQQAVRSSRTSPRTTQHPRSCMPVMTAGKKGFNKHVVTFEADSKLGKIYTAPLAVPTAHHQCIDKVASGFRVVAKTADGLPEAIEKLGGGFVVGRAIPPRKRLRSE